MRNLKKLLAVIVTIAMLATFAIPALAEDTISGDAKISADLGVLKGDGNGVTADYLAKGTTRLQAAILYLRLIGKEADALAFTGTETFADAGKVDWNGGKAILAYLKANPDLGWIGDGTNFIPNDPATAQMLYKVMLTALGFKQGVDFEYVDTLDFAGGKGMSSKAGDDSISNDDTSSILVEALKAKVKDGTATLAEKLVDTGIIAKAAAQTAGLYYIPKALDVASVAVKTSTRVDVALTTAAVQADLDAAVITAKDSAAAALEVTSKTLSADGKSIKITTAAQTGYTAYKLVIAGTEYNFVGQPSDTVKPTAAAVVTSNTSVEVTFSEEVDKALAENIGSYSVDNNLQVLKAELDSAGTKVTLTTSAQTVGTIYKLTVQNITDISGNIMDKTEALFGGYAPDTAKPTAVGVVTSNTEVTVTFTDASKIDKTSAESIGNYVIDNNLAVLTATLDSTGKIVTLTTSAQVVGTIYKLTVQNVKDEPGNTMDKYEVLFGGRAADTAKPTAVGVVKTNTSLTVTFTDESKMNKESAENVANYTIDNGLAVTKASLDTTGKIVTLTTSAQTVGTIYKLTVQNVADAAGNVMDKYEVLFGGYAVDSTAPTANVSNAAGIVTVTFNEEVDSATATNSLNYVFDGGLGYASSASLDNTSKIVTLKTAAQTPSKIYTVTINNVKDLSGNKIATDTKKTFVGKGATASVAYSLQAVSIVNNNTFDLLFSRDLSGGEVAALAVDINKDQGVAYVDPAGLAYVKTQQSDAKVVRVQFKTGASTKPDLLVQGHVYEIVVTGDANLVTANSANVKNVAGTTQTNPDPYLAAVATINSTAIKAVFSEPVAGVVAGAFTINNGIGVASVSVVSGTEVMVYLNNALATSTVYTLTMVAGITDSAGYNALDIAKTANFAGTNVANVAPKMSVVVPVDKFNIDVNFTEAVNGAENANYTVTKVNGPGIDLDLTGAVYTVSADKKKITISIDGDIANNKLVSGTVYKVTMGNIAAVTDDQGAQYDGTAGANIIQFGGVDTENAAPQIAAVSVDATNKILTVVFSEKVTGLGALDNTYLTITGAGFAANIADAYVFDNTKTITITLVNALNENEMLQ